MPSADAVPNNLPVELTTFIGRRAECATVAGLVGANRLVTLIGSGGCGKTRLSQRVAADLGRRYSDGVWWVDLARLSDEALLGNALAAALAIKEVPGQALTDTVRNHLRDKQVLLVLDNCEHVVVSCAALVHELLGACPSLFVLTTSREPLGVEGEVAWRVPSLQLPDRGPSLAVDSLMQSEAVRLFLDRAVRVRSSFRLTGKNAPAVSEICHRIDGIPLAIELAAARVRMMTPEQIVRGLDDRFRLLTGSSRTALARHQTLRASVDWSHGLLADEERIVLRRLSVFAGGFTLEAAEEVCSEDGILRADVLDILSRLVDRSLVQVGDESPAARYGLLETMRQYAHERLVEAGEDDSVRGRHLGCLVALAERAEPEMRAAGLLEWLPVLDVEHDNFRAAFNWGVQAKRSDECLRLSSALALFWMVRGHLTEGRQCFDAALLDPTTESVARAEALIGVGQLMTYHGDLAATREYALEALEIARTQGDERLEGRALDTLGYAAAFLDPPAALDLFAQSLPLLRNSGERWFLADALNGLGIARYFAADYAGACAVLEEAVACSREIGNPNTLTIGLGVLGYTLGLRGRLPRAHTCLLESLAVSRRLGDRVFTAQALYGLGFVEAHKGDHERAEVHLDASVEIAREVSPLILAFALLTQGVSRYIRADLEGALPPLEETLMLSRDIPVPWLRAWTLGIIGNVARIKGGLDEARERIVEAVSASRSGGMNADLPIDASARLARASGEPELAESLHHDALSAAVESRSILLVPMQLEALAGLAALGESYLEAARLFGSAAAAREGPGLVRYAVDEPGYEADVDHVRSALSDADFLSAWQQGRAMSLEEAVAYARRGRGERKRPSTGWGSLTPAEVEVVRHVAEGLTNPQIAERLFVSRSTVKVHLSHIFTKLGVSTRAQLAAGATRRGL